MRLFAPAQIGLVSQAELVLRRGRVMEIRFLEVMGVLSSGLSSARTLASPGSEFDARGCAQHHRASYNADPPPLGLTMEVGMQVRECAGVSARENTQVVRRSARLASTLEKAVQGLSQVLAADPRSVYRRQKCADDLYQVHYDRLNAWCV